ncbi:hypothetical protein ABT263_24915 [Kitasatospora sp. NPDC001603]|uniref:hypothetical protein n=1 Tax=Kitasatospora sp. NPDC001603 TaxID=3154388 RepID=UPI003327EA25
MALLDGGRDPLRISAESDRIDGALRFTGSRTSYPDGVAVSVRYPTSFPDPDSETATDTLEAIEACGLFEDGVLIVDGAAVRAAGYRPVAGGPVRSWTAQSGGWIVTVHGRADDGAVVRVLGAQNPAAPGRPTIPGTI